MAFLNTPVQVQTTRELYNEIIAVYKGFTGVTTVPEKGIISGMAWAMASIFVTLFRLGNWAFRQIFIQTADAQWVEERGNELGIIKKPGQKAIMTASVTGATAASIPAGTLYQINDVVYQTTATATVTSGEATITIQATTAGAEFELSVSDELSLVQPVVGVPSTAIVASVVTEGLDSEDNDEYKTRVDTRIKKPPQGGAAFDYFLWATEVDGIIDVLVYETNSGDVDVYPIADGADEDKLPTAGQLESVEDEIETSGDSEFQDRRPLGASVNVEIASNIEISVVINGFGSDRPQAVKDSIESELTRYFDERRPSNPLTGKVGSIVEVNVAQVLTLVNTITIANGFSVGGVQLFNGPSEIFVRYFIPQGNLTTRGVVTYNA